jgi:hypothetical protein
MIGYLHGIVARRGAGDDPFGHSKRTPSARAQPVKYGAVLPGAVLSKKNTDASETKAFLDVNWMPWSITWRPRRSAGAGGGGAGSVVNWM